jgi:BACON domain-containing protein/all-beta uncharacterized protein
MPPRSWVAAFNGALAALVLAACGQASTTLSTTAPDEPKCQVSVSNPPGSVPPDGGSGTLTVTTARDCTWSAASGATWITLASPATGQGSGSIAYRVDANGQPAARSGTIDVNGSAVTVSQQPAPCRFTVAPAYAAVSASGGTLSVSVQTLSGCSWSATDGDGWVHVQSGATGNAAGTIRLAIDPNTGAARTSQVHVADQTVTIAQAELPHQPPPMPTPTPPPAPTPTPTPTPCTDTLSSTSDSVTAAGGSGTVQIQAPGGCAWTATSNTSWIVITKGTSGTGNGSVSFTVDRNSGAARTGTLTIAGQTFTVSQAAAAPCSYSISPTRQSIAASGGNGTVQVTTTSGCEWTAKSNASWIAITKGASGTGNGSVSYTVSKNESDEPRSGTLTIAGSTLTVTQSGS